MGDDCDIWSDLCAHFSALKLILSTLQKIKLWPRKEYQTFAPRGSVAMLSHLIHDDPVSGLTVCTLCISSNQKSQKAHHRLCIKSLDKQQQEHWDVNFFHPLPLFPPLFFSSVVLQF